MQARLLFSSIQFMSFPGRLQDFGTTLPSRGSRGMYAKDYTLQAKHLSSQHCTPRSVLKHGH